MSWVVCPKCFTKNTIKKKGYITCWKCNFSDKIENFIPSNKYDVSNKEGYKEYVEKANKR